MRPGLAPPPLPTLPRFPPQRRQAGGRRATPPAAVLNRLFSPLRSSAAVPEPLQPAGPASPLPPPPPAPLSEAQSSPVWGFPFRSARPTRSRLPVYVMLPLDTVTRDGVLTNAKALAVGFQARLAAPTG